MSALTLTIHAATPIEGFLETRGLNSYFAKNLSDKDLFNLATTCRSFSRLLLTDPMWKQRLIAMNNASLTAIALDPRQNHLFRQYVDHQNYERGANYPFEIFSRFTSFTFSVMKKEPGETDRQLSSRWLKEREVGVTAVCGMIALSGFVVAISSLVLCQDASSDKGVELLPFDPQGWYLNARSMEKLFKKHKIRTVVEIGSWLGCSTRHIASLLPQRGKIYAVDHWEGSIEHQSDPHTPHLYQQFLSNVIHAGLTDKIVPVKMASLEAASYLRATSRLGLCRRRARYRVCVARSKGLVSFCKGAWDHLRR